MVNVDADFSNDSKEDHGNANPTTLPSSSSSSPFHSLAELIFGVKGPFGKFSANQRLFRLRQCDELQLALEDCEKQARIAQHHAKNNVSSSSRLNNWFPSISDRNKSRNVPTVDKGEKDVTPEKKNSSPPRKIEDTKSGKKISRFYDWGLTKRDFSGPSATAVAASAIGVGDASSIADNSGRTTKSSKIVRRGKKSCSMERHAVWACRAMALGCASDLVKLRECFRDLGTTNPESCHYEDNRSDDDEAVGGMCRSEQRIVAQCVIRKENELAKNLDE